jgi:Domain of unknown function (DUF4149)
MQSGARWAALIAALWAGVLLCIGAIAAPAGFALLPPADAGRVAGRMLAIEAYLGLALAALLFAIERKSARVAAAAGTGSAFSTNIVLLFGALFCTVAGYFAIVPMMAAARAGQGAWSFGALHAASSGLFVLKGLLVLALAWRLTAARR